MQATAIISLLASTLAIAAPTQAQTAANEAAPSERAKRDADKVYQMILQHADKPRRVRDDRAPVAAAVPPRPLTAGSIGAPTISSVAPAGSSKSIDVPGAASPVATPQIEATAMVSVQRVETSLAALPRITKLELVSSVEPDFPQRVRRMVGSGSVLVQFDVRPDGSVSRAEVARSPHRGLNDAAVAAVLAWKLRSVTETVAGSAELRFD